MNIQHGHNMQAGKPYLYDLLDSIMNIITTSKGYKWRGIYNSATSYAKGDVVLYVNNASPVLKESLQTNSNSITSGTAWKDFAIQVDDTTENQLTETLNNLIFSITGSSSFKGTYNTSSNYVKDDVVIVTISGTPKLMRAKESATGTFNIEKWDSLKLLTSTEIASFSTGGSGSVSDVYEITVESTGWVSDSTYINYPFRKNVTNENIHANSSPLITIDPNSLTIAADAALCPTVITEEGVLKIYASAIPSGTMKFYLTITGQATN